MKITKRVFAVLLAVVMFLTAVPFASAKEESSIETYKKQMLEYGFPVISTEEFGAFLRILQTFRYLLTGIEPNTERIEVTYDEIVRNITSQMCTESGLDFNLIAANLPNLNIIPNFFKNKYNIDTTLFREERYAKEAEYAAQGNDLMATICHTIGAFMSIIEKMYVYTVATDEKDVYELVLYLKFEDGTEETHYPGVYINMETGECYGKNGTGVFGIGHNFNFYEMTIYSTVDCWMRNYGFCLFYDVAANLLPTNFKYITRRFKFSYDGLDWMIQMWKGSYFISNGGEVGLYWREKGQLGSFYNCATEEIPMSLQVSIGDKILVNRKLQDHWWICGFNLGEKLYLPTALTLRTTLVMPDKEMLEAFTASIDANVMGDVSYTVDGLSVNVVW
ncbi:MAG: DUF4474 domain-containing protein [Clostridia bacterium]|nr:DUF4474 domain-containing protein [Clostridia bacterium]